jgi:Poly (ADP-ribose) glycohydrolase (PARG)
LGCGAVQEELLLVQFPESLVGLLLFEELRDNEAALIFGARRISKLVGYGADVKYFGPISLNQRGGRMYGSTCIISIDAIHFTSINIKNQLDKVNLDRELLKAFTGFFEPEVYPGRVIGSGKWGCGVFKVGRCDISQIMLFKCKFHYRVMFRLRASFNFLQRQFVEGHWYCT